MIWLPLLLSRNLHGLLVMILCLRLRGQVSILGAGYMQPLLFFYEQVVLEYKIYFYCLIKKKYLYRESNPDLWSESPVSWAIRPYRFGESYLLWLIDLLLNFVKFITKQIVPKMILSSFLNLKRIWQNLTKDPFGWTYYYQQTCMV